MKSFVLMFIVFIGCTPRPRAPEISAQEGVVVAKVGNTLISDKALLERIAVIEKAFPRVYSTHVQKKELLTEMMNIELLYQEALRIGLDKKYEFKSRLADLYVREIAEKARDEISTAQLQKFFAENRANIEQISARHILLKTDPKMKSKEKEAIRTKLEGYRAEILKKPNVFDEYARKYSEDSSGQTGGELGFFARPAMVVPFSTAAFGLTAIGDISPVIETQFGFHLIQLSGDRRGFGPYKNLIREQLFRKTQREQLDREVARLKAGKEFQIYEDYLTKLSPLPSVIKEDPKDLIPEGSVINEKKQ